MAMKRCYEVFLYSMDDEEDLLSQKRIFDIGFFRLGSSGLDVGQGSRDCNCVNVIDARRN